MRIYLNKYPARYVIRACNKHAPNLGWFPGPFPTVGGSRLWRMLPRNGLPSHVLHCGEEGSAQSAC